MTKKLYVAYGSNLNFRQMKYRCPTAKLYGTGMIQNYELQFKGLPNNAFATIVPKAGTIVPVAVWEIQPKDERSLDHYEGYPSFYFKQNVPVQLDGEEVSAMVYIMNPVIKFGIPSPNYYQSVLEGYRDCELDTAVLDEAVTFSTQQYYRESNNRFGQQTLFENDDPENNPEYEDKNLNDEEEDLAEEQSKVDGFEPICFSEGMH